MLCDWEEGGGSHFAEFTSATAKGTCCVAVEALGMAFTLGYPRKEYDMAFWNLDTLRLEEFRPGILSKAQFGDNLIMVCMQIEAGKEDTGHKHNFDQCGIVLDGQMEMFIGDERRLLNPNESYFISSGIQHGWKTFDRPVKILDISLNELK